MKTISETTITIKEISNLLNRRENENIKKLIDMDNYIITTQNLLTEQENKELKYFRLNSELNLLEQSYRQIIEGMKKQKELSKSLDDYCNYSSFELVEQFKSEQDIEKRILIIGKAFNLRDKLSKTNLSETEKLLKHIINEELLTTKNKEYLINVYNYMLKTKGMLQSNNVFPLFQTLQNNRVFESLVMKYNKVVNKVIESQKSGNKIINNMKRKNLFQLKSIDFKEKNILRRIDKTKKLFVSSETTKEKQIEKISEKLNKSNEKATKPIQKILQQLTK